MYPVEADFCVLFGFPFFTGVRCCSIPGAVALFSYVRLLNQVRVQIVDAFEVQPRGLYFVEECFLSQCVGAFSPVFRRGLDPFALYVALHQLGLVCNDTVGFSYFLCFLPI